MNRSNVAQGSLYSESTNEEHVTPINNNSNNLTESDHEVNKRVEDHWKYLVFDKKKNQSLQTMENKGSNESDNSYNEIRSGISTELEVAGESSANMTEANLSNNHSIPDQEEMSSDNNTIRESVSGGNQQANKFEGRRKSVIFTSKRKLSFHRTDDEAGFDDSGLVLNDSNEIDSPVKSESMVAEKTSTLSKTISFHDNNTSDEGEASIDNSSKNESTAGENQQDNQSVPRRKLFTSKRKLSSQEPEDVDQLDESDGIPSKRGRGKYKLRDLPKNNFPDKVNKKKPHDKRRAKKSTVHNTSRANAEDDTEDSAEEDELEDYETHNKDESISKSRAAYNKKILKLINEGSPAKLKTLNRVGHKTAMMIHQYRKMNGKLESIRDLENMSGWSPKYFEMFLSANNIDLD